MLLWLLIALAGAILWKSGNVRTRKAIVYAAAGLVVVTFVHSAMQINISYSSSVTLQSENVVEGELHSYHQEKQQYLP